MILVGVDTSCLPETSLDTYESLFELHGPQMFQGLLFSLKEGEFYREYAKASELAKSKGIFKGHDDLSEQWDREPNPYHRGPNGIADPYFEVMGMMIWLQQCFKVS